MATTSLIFVAVPLVACLLGLRAAMLYLYRRGRQVEFRVARGTGTGEVIGFSGLRVRVRSLSSGREHTVSVANVRRR
jgi:hypothetical protein